MLTEINSLFWWHVIDLGNGIKTPGRDPTTWKIDLCRWPDLHGKTVLDIGCWDGALSFEAERRGAARVLATDHFVWHDPRFSGRRPFDLAHQALGSRVESLDIDVLDLSPERVGVWDVVLFCGVLYHMRHPLLSLERVRSVTQIAAMVEGHHEPQLEPGRPAGVFYEHDELAGDATNWWGFNVAGYCALIRSAGFAEARFIGTSGSRIGLHAICETASA